MRDNLAEPDSPAGKGSPDSWRSPEDSFPGGIRFAEDILLSGYNAVRFSSFFFLSARCGKLIENHESESLLHIMTQYKILSSLELLVNSFFRH
jgi:hypothetical protein